MGQTVYRHRDCKMEQVGWYCPRCKALVEHKKGGSRKGREYYLVSCNCYPSGAHICIFSDDDNNWHDADWYLKTIELQKKWKRVYRNL